MAEPQEGDQEQAKSVAMRRQIDSIWMTILNRNSASPADNFSVLGGQSLQVIKLLATVSQRFNIKLKPAEFGAEPTLSNLYSQVERATAES